MKGLRLLVPLTPPKASPRSVRKLRALLNEDEVRAILLGCAMGCAASALVWPALLMAFGRWKLALGAGALSVALAFTAVLAALCEGERGDSDGL
jgi:hypothetical protein